METDSETHKQTLGEPQDILQKRRWRIMEAIEVKDTTGKHTQSQLTWARGGSQRLTLQPENLYGTDLGPLYMSCSCVVWSSCGTPDGGSRGFLWLCCLHLAPFPPLGLPHPALIKENVPGLAAAWYPMTGWCTWKACAFLTGRDKEWMGEGEVERRNCKEKREGGKTVIQLGKNLIG